jgi:hypothetical protein
MMDWGGVCESVVVRMGRDIGPDNLLEMETSVIMGSTIRGAADFLE